MAKVGRKTKLTPKLQEQIVKYIEAGNYAKDACQMVGISERIYEIWNKEGLEIEAKCFDDNDEKVESKWQKLTEFEKAKFRFFRSIKKAKSKAVIRNVLNIQKAGRESWTASAWWLERTHFKEWGDKKSVGVRFETPLEIKGEDVKKEIMDKLNTMAERLKKRDERKNIKKGK